jgi:hypothetical protein
VRVPLVTHWTVNPGKWADAHGCDPSTCARDVIGDLTSAIATLPIYEEHEDLTPREAQQFEIEAPRPDGLLRFTLSWLIETTAQRWREGRATYNIFAEVPEQHRAYDDVALVTARELFGHAQVWEADTVMRVLAPFTATYTRQMLS